jgi:hypothetical protein
MAEKAAATSRFVGGDYVGLFDHPAVKPTLDGCLVLVPFVPNI